MPINMALIWCIDMQSVHPHGHILEFSALFHKELSKSRQTDISHLMSGVGGWGRGVDSAPKSDSKLLNFSFNWKKLLFKMYDWKLWKRDTDGKSVSSSGQTSEVLEMKGKTEKERASVWVRVCWRQWLCDPAFRAPVSIPEKEDHKHPALSLGEIQELEESAPHDPSLLEFSWQQTCLIVIPAQGLRTAGKTAGHRWAGESRHRIEELFRALNSGTEGCVRGLRSELI